MSSTKEGRGVDMVRGAEGRVERTRGYGKKQPQSVDHRAAPIKACLRNWLSRLRLIIVK